MSVSFPSFLPDTFSQIPDERDRVIFAPAYTANAIFVTGNHRHFPWSSCHGVRVCSPRDFYDLL